MAHTVMVTGADGFIGSHLTEELVKRGEKVRAFCLYNSFGSLGWIDTLPPEIRSEIDIFMGDVRDPNGVRTAMRGQERVFHLAALIAIPFSYHSPDSYVDTNIKGTLNVLNAARELDTQRVLVTSTSEVYGTAQYVPIDEKHPFQGQSPYSATKIGADRLEHLLDCQRGLPFSTVFALREGTAFRGLAGCPPVDTAAGIYGLFYQLLPACWGRGLGLAAAAEALRRLERLAPALVLADTVAENTASVRILERLGFVRTAVHHRAFCREGRMLDIWDYARRWAGPAETV